MGVFKQLTSQDIIISPLEVSKPYTASIVPIFSSSGGYSYISYATGRYSESLERIDAYGFENNNSKFFQALVRGSSFKLNCEETLSSDFVFVRARNAEFNYSENPSYIKGTTGEVYWDYFINSPQSYITTVGLYNDNNDLLAVAKLSKPLPKDFTKEALIRVKLDF